MAVDQDTEITLGTGKMLALFFGLVALCAVFFAMGYSLGRNSLKSTVVADTPPSPALTRPVTRPASSENKPSDLSFYKTVEQKGANAQLTQAEPTGTIAPASAPPGQPDASSAKQNAPPDPTVLPSANSYYVQVAAVSKPEDADALVEALKKKQYPAFTASGSADKLFHVQVGPYGDIKDAEAMRAKLISDGYNPILKK